MDVLRSFLSHGLLHVSSSVILDSVTSLTPNEFHHLCQKPSAIVNALCVSLPALHQFNFVHPFDSNLLYSFPAQIEALFDSHLGYTLYDLLVMVRHHEHYTEYIHHIFGVIGILLLKKFRQGAIFPALFLPTEFTVLISTVIWIVKTLKIKVSLKPLLFSRLLLFVCLRGLTPGLSCIVYPIARIINNKKISVVEASKIFANRLASLRMEVKIGLLINVSTFSILNLYWTILTYRAVSNLNEIQLHHV